MFRSTVNTPDLESPALGFRAPGLPLSSSSRNTTTPRYNSLKLKKVLTIRQNERNYTISISFLSPLTVGDRDLEIFENGSLSNKSIYR